MQAIDGQKEDIKNAREASLQLRGWLRGVSVMLMLGRYDSAEEVMEVLKGEAAIVLNAIGGPEGGTGGLAECFGCSK